MANEELVKRLKAYQRRLQDMAQHHDIASDLLICIERLSSSSIGVEKFRRLCLAACDSYNEADRPTDTMVARNIAAVIRSIQLSGDAP